MNPNTPIIGKHVQTIFGERLGEVVEAKYILVKFGEEIFDQYVVLVSGLLGKQDCRLLVLPLEAFQSEEVKQEGDPMMLIVEKELLERGPAFERDDYPECVDLSVLDSVYLHYGFKKYRCNYTII